MEQFDSGMEQITKPIADTLLYVPRETLKAGKEMAAAAPRKAFRAITDVSLKVVRLPLLLLMNIPFLPNGTNIGRINESMRGKYYELLRGAGRA